MVCYINSNKCIKKKRIGDEHASNTLLLSNELREDDFLLGFVDEKK